MSLSCECGFDDFESWYEPSYDFVRIPLGRRKRCKSCNELISMGSDVVALYRWRMPRSGIEENIHGDEVEQATQYFCEDCGGIYYSLIDLGFCINLDGTSMRELAKEYNEIYIQKMA